MLVLNVATDSMKIEMNSQKASLNLDITEPQIQIETEAARLEISQSKGQLQIDSTAFRSSYGIKNWQSFSRDNAQTARSIGLEAIGSKVDEGNRMAQIESKQDVIVEIAVDSSFPALGELAWTPLEKPEIHYKVNRPQISFTDGSFDLTLQRGHVQSEFQPGKVTISVAQYPSIRKWTSENKVDLML